MICIVPKSINEQTQVFVIAYGRRRRGHAIITTRIFLNLMLFLRGGLNPGYANFGFGLAVLPGRIELKLGGHVPKSRIDTKDGLNWTRNR